MEYLHVAQLVMFILLETSLESLFSMWVASSEAAAAAVVVVACTKWLKYLLSCYNVASRRARLVNSK